MARRDAKKSTHKKAKALAPIEITLIDLIIERIEVPPTVNLAFYDDTKIPDARASFWAGATDSLGYPDTTLPEVKLFFDGEKFSRFGNSAKNPVIVRYSESYQRGEFAEVKKTVKLR